MRLNVPISDRYSLPLRHALIQQALLLVLSALMLDFGTMSQITGIAFLAYWGGAVVMILRRPLCPSRLDLCLMRWSFLPLLIVVQITARWVWHWRGFL
jgi:hypothetical protein